VTAAATPRTELLELLAELYPGDLALGLLPLCAPRCEIHHGAPCSSPGKRPLDAGWTAAAAARWADADGDADRWRARIADHAARGGNIGWCPPKRVLVLDADTPEAVAYLERALPDAPMQETASGAHYVVRLPEGVTVPARCGVELAAGIAVDLRPGGAAQIVVAPSIHASGAAYCWRRQLPADPAELPEIPAGLAALMPAEGARRIATHADDGDEIPAGRRNATLTSLAGTMRRRGMSAEEIDVALGAVNTNRCRPPLDDAEVAAIARSVGRYRTADAPGEGEPVSSRSLVTVMMARVRGERVTWLWPGRLPLGKLSILDGDPGLGKSLLTLDLAARVSTGARMPDGAPGIEGGAGVVLLSAEDGLGDTIRPRLEAAGADLERVVAVTEMPTDDGPRLPELPEDVLAVEQVVRDTGARLVVVDPLMAYLAGGVNANRDHDVRRALAPLAAMAARTGAAVLVVRHLNKGGSAGGNPIYRGGGSIGIIGAARSGLLVARDPDDPDRRILAVTKANLAAPVPALRWRLVDGPDGLVAEWLGASEHTAATLMAEPEGDERTARDEAAEWLRDVLRDGPQPAAEVKRRARADGIADRTLDRAKARLGVRAAKAGMAGGWTWSL